MKPNKLATKYPRNGYTDIFTVYDDRCVSIQSRNMFVTAVVTTFPGA